MEARGAAAAAVFLWTFVVLALGRVTAWPIARGWASLVGGLVTALILRLSPAVIDVQVMLLLAGLMVMAGLAEAAGLFAGLRRTLVQLPAWQALWASCALMALVSAALLNDAAVVVLIPFLLPALRGLGVPVVPAVALLAVASNLGSLLTPFGNPQDAVLAAHAHLSLLQFVTVQGPFVLFGLALLGLASWRACRKLGPVSEQPPHATPRGRTWVMLCVGLFLVLAAAAPWGLGTSAAVCATLAWLGLRFRIVDEADAAAWKGLDWNVLALFVGLYFLTGGLPAWIPPQWQIAGLKSPVAAAAATTVLSNSVGNVPAILTFVRLDPVWTLQHAMFLVTVSTMGGALLLTGSAASLLAADQARKLGVEVRFTAFLQQAWWALPILIVGAWATW